VREERLQLTALEDEISGKIHSSFVRDSTIIISDGAIKHHFLVNRDLVGNDPFSGAILLP
jgi:hypothetical protein